MTLPSPRQLSELVHGMALKRAGPVHDPVVRGISDDSRCVKPGWLFIGRTGSHQSGTDYVQQALAAGAVAVIYDTPSATLPVAPPPAVPTLMAPRIDGALLAELAWRAFGDPNRLRLVGVTGTNGKTTVATLVQSLLNHAGIRCGLVGTVVMDDGVHREAASLTTPGTLDLYRLLGRMHDNGCRAVAMEVSSHALDQSRVAGLNFEAAIFTNLTGDHLDYHGTMQAYAQAKAKLFTPLSPQAHAVVNADDAYAAQMVHASRARVMRCSLVDGEAACRASVLSMSATGTRVRMEGPWGGFEAVLPLVGRHNVMNALQALATAESIIARGPAWREALERVPSVPGRLERVRSDGGEGPSVFVDYAHTHDALENVLTTLRPLVPSGAKLWCVFGCGGDRDRTKRPKMAAVAARLADRVIITSDNPRTEDPGAIIDEITRGLPIGFNATVEPDRAAALRHAIHHAADDDLILIAGKGHEDYQIIGSIKHPFDDRLHAAAALRERLTPAHR